jgi:hypothetical protein
MSGHGGHALAKAIAENNPIYRWYDHPRNSKDHPDRFPELKLSDNHFRKKFADNSTFPHLFDRIEPWLTNIDAYYDLIEPEIESISQDKRLVYVCHELPSIIKARYPNCHLVQLLPTEDILDSVIDRHMITHMLYPVQSGIHHLPGRKELLNNRYWDQHYWAKQYKDDSLINYISYKEKKPIKAVKEEERGRQKELFALQLSESLLADASIQVKTIDDAIREYNDR